METIEDDYQRLSDKLTYTKRELPKLSPVQMLWIAPHIDALYDDIEHLRNQHYFQLYDSCGKQDVQVSEEDHSENGDIDL
jgi:hypothetical protein